MEKDKRKEKEDDKKLKHARRKKKLRKLKWQHLING
jgi:hypothetical protein